MKKNILYICPSSGIGGAETFLISTARHSNQSEFNNVYLLFNQGPLQSSLEKWNAKVVLLAKRPRLSRPWDRRQVRKAIASLVQKHDIQLIHSTMAYGALFAAKSGKSLKIPHIWFQHGPASGWMDRLAGILNHQALISNSNYTQETQLQLERPLKTFVPKNRVLKTLALGTSEPEGISATKSQLQHEFLASKNLNSQSLLVSMLCRIQKWKGVHHFIEAFRYLKHKSQDPPMVGLIWGESFNGDTYLQDLENIVRKEQLPIFFMGLTNNPKKALLMSDILVNASIQPEPFGLSIIEAMACKTAVIVPAEGGPAEIVRHQKDGLTFSPRKPKALAQSLIQMGEAQNLQSFQSAAYQRFQENFTATKMVSLLEKEHATLIAQQQEVKK